MQRLAWLTVGGFVLLLHPNLWAGEPSVPRKGVGFQTECRPDLPNNNCRSLRVPSPNKKNLVEVRYWKDKETGVLSAYLEVTRGGRRLGSADAREFDPGSDDDLLWSPDSTKFFVNRGGEQAIGVFWMDVYRLDDPKLAPIDITAAALKDMVATFPPCRAKNLMYDCHELTDDPGSFINMSGVDWLPDSSAIVVMAEVMPSTRFGGIMGEVMGYVVEVPSGKIMQRMTAHEFARRWQHSLAFKFEDPGPPDYKNEHGEEKKANTAR